MTLPVTASSARCRADGRSLSSSGTRHSVLYPILVSRWMFPTAAGRRWFASGRARWLLYVLLVILTGLYALYFLNPVRSDLGVFLLYAAASVGLVASAVRFCRTRPASPSPARTYLWPAVLGGST